MLKATESPLAKNCCGFLASQAKAKWTLWTTHTVFNVSLCLSPSTTGEVDCSWLKQWDFKTKPLLSAVFNLHALSYEFTLIVGWLGTGLFAIVSIKFCMFFHIYSQVWVTLKILYPYASFLSLPLPCSQTRLFLAMAETPTWAPHDVWDCSTDTENGLHKLVLDFLLSSHMLW